MAKIAVAALAASLCASAVAYADAPRLYVAASDGLYELDPVAATATRVREGDFAGARASFGPYVVGYNVAVRRDGAPLTLDAARVTAWAEAWSRGLGALTPDGTTLVYLARRPGAKDREEAEVHAVDLVTGEERALTRDGSRKREVALSPDGATVVFSANRDGVRNPRDPRDDDNNDLYAVPLAGGDVRRLTTTNAVGMPVFGGDGKLYFVTWGSGPFEPRVMELARGKDRAVKLPRGAQLDRNGIFDLLRAWPFVIVGGKKRGVVDVTRGKLIATGGDDHLYELQSSTDGKTFAAHRKRESETKPSPALVWSHRGGTPRAVLTLPRERWTTSWALSADGNYLAATIGGDDGKDELVIVDAKGAARPVTGIERPRRVLRMPALPPLAAQPPPAPPAPLTPPAPAPAAGRPTDAVALDRAWSWLLAVRARDAGAVAKLTGQDAALFGTACNPGDGESGRVHVARCLTGDELLAITVPEKREWAERVAVVPGSPLPAEHAAHAARLTPLLGDRALVHIRLNSDGAIYDLLLAVGATVDAVSVAHETYE